MIRGFRARTSGLALPSTAGLVALLAVVLAISAAALTIAGQAGAKPELGTTQCAPGVSLYGFSDVLDKTTYRGTAVGGLSGIT